MKESWNEGPQVGVSFMLPEPLYAWIEYAAAQRGVTVSVHVREWVIRSLAPWDYDNPLPLDVDEGPYQKAEQARGQTIRQPKGIPEHIKAIAAARREQPALSLRAFSQYLFDNGIYQSWGWGPHAGKPVNSATLSTWLKQAREAGLLPKKAMPTRAPKAKTVAYPKKA